MKKSLSILVAFVLISLILLTSCSMKGSITFQIPNTSVEEGKELRIDLKKYFSGANPVNYSFSVEGEGEIQGLFYVLYPDFNSEGVYEVTVTATDARGKKVTSTFSLTVLDTNREPLIEVDNQSVLEDMTLELDLNEFATDPDNDSLEFEIVNGVGSVSNGIFSYKAGNEAPNVYRITVKATDGKGGKSFAVFSLAVINVNQPPFTPGTPFPQDGAMDAPGKVLLSWKSGDPDGHRVTYEVYLGSHSGMKLIAANLKESSYNVEDLEDSTKYTWKIVAKDSFGGVSEGPVWAFSTSSKPGVDWQRSLGGSETDKGLSIIQTSDGGYVVSGYTKSSDGTVSGSSVSGNAAKSDGWIVKLDDKGYYQWQRTIASSGITRVNKIVQTSDGGFVTVGVKYNPDNGSNDLWISSLNKYSTIQWQRLIGGKDDEIGYSLSPTQDGGFIVVGSGRSDDVDGLKNHGGYDFWVMKLDKNGEIIWKTSLGGDKNDMAYDVKQTPDGGFVVVGETASNGGDVKGYTSSGYSIGGLTVDYPDIWVVRLTYGGELLWSKCIGGKGDDSARSVALGPDGTFIVTGYTSSATAGGTTNYDAVLAKLDAEGEILWTRNFGTARNEKGNGIIVTGSGSIVVLGSIEDADSSSVYSLGSAGQLESLKNDVYLLKTTGNGEILWEETYGGPGNDIGYDIQQSSDGGYILAITSDSNGRDVRGNHGKEDIWVLKIRN